VGDLVGRLDVSEVGEALTDVTAATLRATLLVAARAVERERGQLPTRLAVVAMGRLGGHEMSYGSDADVMFVHDPVEGASEQDASDTAHAVANELRRLLHVGGPDPALEVDADLRPEGRQGPLVRTLASYAAYYERWAKVWESQALLRAEPIAGDHELGLRFVALVNPLRYPEAGLDGAAVREIRRIKARVESERLPRGVDPTQHIKLGPGGIADVEWVAQLVQLRHAHEFPRLRTTRTLSAVYGAVAADLLSRADGDTLAAAWQLATRVRNAMVLVRGRPSDTLPRNPRELSGIARVLGYPPSTVGDLLDDYRRATRRARAVVEREFYA
jgi:glutamate-ammonia-ligase adenylyltransferase